MYYDLLFYCLITSLVCVGVFASTEKGNPLYFFKKPVLSWLDDIERERKNDISAINLAEQEGTKSENMSKVYKERRDGINEFYDEQSKFVTNIYKPIFLCPRCMASVWSLLIWVPLTCYHYDIWTAFCYIIPAMFVTVTMNSILYNQSDL